MAVHIFQRVLTTHRFRALQMCQALIPPALLSPQSTLIHLVRNLATFGNRPSLADRGAEFLAVIREWHPHRNTINPSDVTPFSTKRVWFMCSKGHEWEARLDSRTYFGSGCPSCNNTRVTETNNLLAKNPAVANEWHPTKNGDLTSEDVTSSSNMKVWWKCKNEHEWEARVFSRTTAKSGCSKCFQERSSGAPKSRQSLLAAHPDLAQEWHPTKNGMLTPDAVSRASAKKVWWQCSRDQTHEWETSVTLRSTHSTGCPICKCRRQPLTETNNLLVLFPEVAQEWHPTLNGEITADKVAGKSRKKVWWACKGCGHEWQAAIASRTARRTGCPMCAR
eukprot:Colp12_sorted_trinity150504_noHs@31264